MKELKRQAREKINDLLEKQCEPCTKKSEVEPKYLIEFGRDYCNVHCGVGRDLKKLGEFLIKREDKHLNTKMKPTKENYEKLKADGLTDTLIRRAFEIDHNKLYKFKKEWKLVGERGRPKPSDEVSEIKVVEMPTIQPDYSRELEKFKEEIALLKEANQAMREKILSDTRPVEINREMYQENAELKQNLKEKEKVILGLFEDYKALETKYEAVASALKVTL